jgi:hypothetical protein
MNMQQFLKFKLVDEVVICGFFLNPEIRHLSLVMILSFRIEAGLHPKRSHQRSLQKLPWLRTTCRGTTPLRDILFFIVLRTWPEVN